MSERVTLRDESGTALLLALALMAILGVLASVVALTAQTETLVAGRFQQGRALMYAADGAFAHALADLAVSDWSAALAGAPSSFAHGDPRAVHTAHGIGPFTLCCGDGTLTQAVEHAANGSRNWGADTPQWRLYAWGPVASWLGGDRIRVPFYSGVWIADDPSDNDGDPVTDTNHAIALFAAALGPAGGRRALRALVARPENETGIPLPRGIRIVSWHETQW